MFALTSNLKIYLVIAAVAALIGTAGYFYVGHLRSQVETMQTQLEATQTALRANEDAIRLHSQTLADVQAALSTLSAADAQVDREVAALRRRVNAVLQVTNDPTTARPEAEAAINDLSRTTLDRLRGAMTRGSASDGSQ